MSHLLSRFALLATLSMFVLGPVTSFVFAQESALEKADNVNGEHGHAEGEHEHEATNGKAAPAHAEGDEAHSEGDQAHSEHVTPPLLSFNPGSAVCNILIFLGVFAILSKFVWPAILGGLTAREEKIHADLEGAEKANAEAKGLLADYQAKLDDAASQAQTVLAEARRDAEASGARIVEEAKAEAQRQSDRAIADIETAKKVALSDIAGQTSNMAINVAKQVVGRELKESDHADLIRQSLDRLPSNN